MTVQLADADPLPEDETALGHKVGDKWTNASRQWGGGSVADGRATLTANFATPSNVTGDGIGEKIAKIQFGTATKNDANIEWYQPGNKQIENGHTYKITMVYFVESFASDVTLKLNFEMLYGHRPFPRPLAIIKRKLLGRQQSLLTSSAFTSKEASPMVLFTSLLLLSNWLRSINNF